MTSRFLGLLIGERTHAVYSIIEPDNDADLDNPRWLFMHTDKSESVQMVKLLREDYASVAGSEIDLAALLEAKR